MANKGDAMERSMGRQQFSALNGVLISGVAVIVGFVGSGIVSAFFVGNSDGQPGASTELLMQPLPLVTISLAMATGFMFISLLGSYLLGRDRIHSLRLRSAPGLAFLVAPLGTLSITFVAEHLAHLAERVAARLGYEVGVQLELIADAIQTLPVALSIFALALLPAIGEELVFRGVLLRSFRNRWLAIIVSGVVFALVHGDPMHIAGVLLLGLYFSWLGDRFQSTSLTIWLHFVNNAVAVLATKYFEVGGVDEEEPPSIWTALIGLLVFALIVTFLRRIQEPRFDRGTHGQ